MQALNHTEDESSENKVEEVRLQIPSISHPKVYLTIECCNDAWHLILETYSDCIGEVMLGGSPSIQMLKNTDIEAESI